VMLDALRQARAADAAISQAIAFLSAALGPATEGGWLWHRKPCSRSWSAATSSPATGRSRKSWTPSSAVSARPDIGSLLAKLAVSTSYEEFSSLAWQARRTP